MLGFDRLGEGFVLTTELNWPQDLVGLIEAWIAERKKIGRCVRSKCAKCGQEIYGCQSESAPLCYDGRAGAKPAKRAWRRMRELLWGLPLVAGAFALTVVVATIFLGQWVDRSSGWLFIAMLLLVLVATLVSTGKRAGVNRNCLLRHDHSRRQPGSIARRQDGRWRNFARPVQAHHQVDGAVWRGKPI